MPNPENIRLAVLIDADNTSPKHAEALLEEVAKYGVPTVRRAYGDWTDSHLSGWMKKVRGLALQPMLQVAHTSGKNSTDSALIIDAMDLLYSGNVDAFALVSSDSDFTSLATRLRASGKTVYGLGLRKTPESLRRAVDRFIFLEDLDDVSTDEHREEQTDAGSPSARRVPDLRRLLERAITSTSHDDGWASLSSVANHVIRVEPSFSVKDYGASKLVDLVRAQSYVDVDQPESGPVRVRLAVKEPPKTSTPEKSNTEKSSSARSSTRKRTEKPVEKPAAEAPSAEPAPDKSPEKSPEKAPAKKAATKKAATTRTRKRTVSQAPAAAEPAAEPTPEPTPEASPEPAGKPQVTTRKRSSRSSKPL